MRTSERDPGAGFPARRPVFYYITDRRQLGRVHVLEAMRRAVRIGTDFIQIREKDLSDLELYEFACRAVEIARGSTCRILVNGRADVAIAAGAHGVHLPSRGLKVGDVRSWLPAGCTVGVSVHSAEEARRTARQGADYILLGPIYRTPSKIRYGAPLGLGTLRDACSRVSIPILGLGGINPSRVPAVLRTGAAGVAGISLFQKHPGFRPHDPPPDGRR